MNNGPANTPTHTHTSAATYLWWSQRAKRPVKVDFAPSEVVNVWHEDAVFATHGAILLNWRQN